MKISTSFRFLAAAALTVMAAGACGSSDSSSDAIGGSSDAGPGVCGNGMVDGRELCDGLDFKGATCASRTLGASPNGALSCISCILVETGCTRTGAGTGGTPGAAGRSNTGGSVGTGGVNGGGFTNTGGMGAGTGGGGG